MSTDWNIKCLDCGDTHRFDDANHMDREMSILIKHADAIAALDDLMKDTNVDIEFRLGVHYGRIDTGWFKEHAKHKLWPIDEYGQLLEQCHGYARCEMGHDHHCVLKAEHDGPHRGVP